MDEKLLPEDLHAELEVTLAYVFVELGTPWHHAQLMASTFLSTAHFGHQHERECEQYFYQYPRYFNEATNLIVGNLAFTMVRNGYLPEAASDIAENIMDKFERGLCVKMRSYDGRGDGMM